MRELVQLSRTQGLQETMQGTIIIGASYPKDFLENHIKKVLGVI